MTSHGPLDFDSWDEITRSPIYRGQVDPTRKWVRGLVLDVAANVGRFSSLAETTVSVDLERRYLIRGRDLQRIRNPVAASALTLPFRDASFDTIIAMGIVDHIPRRLTKVFLQELGRVAKADGRLIVQVTSSYSYMAIRSAKSYNDFVHPFSPILLRRLLHSYGWTSVAAISSGLLGSMGMLTRTVTALVPWAVHVTLVFDRRPQSK